MTTDPTATGGTTGATAATTTRDRGEDASATTGPATAPTTGPDGATRSGATAATPTSVPPRTGVRRSWVAPAVVGVVLVVFAGLLPLLNISVPGVLPGPTYLPGALGLLALCFLYAALALSYHLVYGVAGMLSFGHALYFGAGAYGLALLLKYEIDFAVAIVLVVLGVAVLAHVVGAVSLRVAGVSFAMVTLAFAQAGNVAVRRGSAITGGEEGLRLETADVPDLLVGVLNTKHMFWLALAILVLVYVVVTWFQSSRAGHVVEATRENETRVRVMGQGPYPIRVLTFGLAGVLAAIVGMAYVLLQSTATPHTTSADMTISVLIMVVLGGVGSRWGAITGAIVYTLLVSRLSTLAATESIQSLPAWLEIPLSEPNFILGALFILVVLFTPGGIAGGLTRLWARLTGRRTGGARASRARLEDVA
ncbi:branched-chain amino acid ABC transporter permease [Georgenia sp. Z1344]|uniref:branched-chain amino acid ABC transporter permease n=1 Tax=Georgenia sp. Z1344 TaxID=3416706 RepID=UPI003CEFC534